MRHLGTVLAFFELARNTREARNLELELSKLKVYRLQCAALAPYVRIHRKLPAPSDAAVRDMMPGGRYVPTRCPVMKTRHQLRTRRPAWGKGAEPITLPVQLLDDSGDAETTLIIEAWSMCKSSKDRLIGARPAAPSDPPPRPPPTPIQQSTSTGMCRRMRGRQLAADVRTSAAHGCAGLRW